MALPAGEHNRDDVQVRIQDAMVRALGQRAPRHQDETTARRQVWRLYPTSLFTRPSRRASLYDLACGVTWHVQWEFGAAVRQGLAYRLLGLRFRGLLTAHGAFLLSCTVT